MLIDQDAPLYDIEEQFEKSISLTDGDIPRYFYATFLVRVGEYHRAIEHLNFALNHKDAAKEFVLSQRGRANTRLGRLDEATLDFTEVLEIGKRTSYTSDKASRINHTQLADLYRRVAEQAYLADDLNKTAESLLQAAKLLDDGMTMHDIDPKLAGALIDVAMEVGRCLSMNSPHHTPLLEIFTKWDGKSDFRRSALADWATLQRRFTVFAINLPNLFPNLYDAYLRLSSDDPVDLPEPTEVDGLVGKIRFYNGRYGFIECPIVDETSIYFNQTSMAPGLRMPDVTTGDFVEFTVEMFERGPAARNLKLVTVL